MTVTVVNESYRFGQFLLVPARRELWCSGQRVPVQPRVLETLTYLIQHRDRAVGRDELIAAVWGRVDINDNLLSQIVGRVRQLVGDTGEEQHSLRTVPRFGYGWIGHVEIVPAEPDGEAELTVAPVKEPRALQRSRSWRRWTIAAALMLLCAAGFTGWSIIRRPANDLRGTMIANGNASMGTDAERLQKLHIALASDQLDTARAIIRTLSDQDRTRPEVRYEAAELALKEGRSDEAQRAFAALLTTLGGKGPAILIGQTLYGAGQAEFRQDHVEPAQRYYERAIDVLASAGPGARVPLGLAWSSLGRLHSTREAFDEAERAYAEARESLQGTGDAAALAQLESNVGVTLIGRYRYADALSHFQRAADLAATTNDANNEARARMNLANAHVVLLQPAAALESEPRLRQLRDRVGDPVLAARVDLVRARVLTANGRLDQAALVLRASASSPTPEDTTTTAFRDLVSAELAIARGELDQGSRHLRSLLAAPWDTFGDDGVAAYARWRLLEVTTATDDAQGIAQAITATDALRHVRPNEPTVDLYASLTAAEAAEARGDSTSARAAFQHALAQAETTRVPFDLVSVIACYARFLLQHGEPTKAGALAERLSSWADHDYTASLVQLAIYHATDSEAWRAALARTRRLAGERTIPSPLATPPVSFGEVDRAAWLARSDVLTP
jgi:DNA-binding winged helix-turn-helix (wHTH) protein/tetratricopeptide (TPR) repeat protein